MGRPHPLIVQLADQQRALDLSNIDVYKLTGVHEKTVRYLKAGMRDGMLDTVDQLAWGMGYVLTLTYVGAKECTGCDEVKPLTGFTRDRETSDGVSRRCKKCQSQYYKQARAAA